MRVIRRRNISDSFKDPTEKVSIEQAFDSQNHHAITNSSDESDRSVAQIERESHQSLRDRSLL